MADVKYYGKYRATVVNNVDPMQVGRIQAIVYYRPLTDWTNRRIWLHAYRGATIDNYLDPEPVITGSSVSKPGELDWAVFELPPGRYHAYVGILVGTSLGSGYPIGVLP